jgi:predicted permease
VLPEDIARGARTALLVVLGAVTLIVLIACVNVANLLLVWATGQQRDVAVRLALGASRGDIVAEYAVRGLVFGAVGGAAGVLVGVWVRDALVALAPPSVIPHVGAISLNARVLGVAFGLALSTGLVASLLPALQVARRRVASSLRDGALSVVGARSVLQWRGVLLAAEVAAAVVLALGAGLLVRSLVLVDRIDLGFTTNRVATMMVRLPAAQYPDADARLRFFESLQARLAALPGVEAAAYANQFPMRGGWGGDMLIEAATGPVEGEADLQAVSPGYFATLGLHLRRGRTFTAADRGGTAGVAVVSETFASRFLAGEDPVGRIIRRHAAAPPLTIVGVVAEVRRDGKFVEAAPQVYLSALQPSLYASDLAAVAVRATGDPLAIVPLVRQAVAAENPALVVAGVRTLDEILNASVASLRFHTWLLVLLGALALTLAMVGVYGVVNYVVLQRTREMGLRLALGATRAQVMRVVIGGGLRWAVAGIAIGVALAAAASRVLSSLLFETAPHDAATFVAVAAIVAGVAFVAAWVPARRAIAGDPVAALRGE